MDSNVFFFLFASVKRKPWERLVFLWGFDRKFGNFIQMIFLIKAVRKKNIAKLLWKMSILLQSH